MRQVFAKYPAVRKRGGIVPANAGPFRQWFDETFLQRAYQIVDRLAPPEQAKKIYIDFVAREGVGAFAFSAEGFDFIGLHVGFSEMIWLYHFLMADPAVLPRVGNASLEQSHAPFDVCFARKAPLSSFRQPCDPLRTVYAQQLTLHCLDFLVAHELGHLLHGHIKYKEIHGTVDAVTNHALENDADHFGINTVLSYALDFARSAPDLPSPLCEIYSNLDKGVFVPLFAVAILYGLMWLDDLRFWHLERPEKSHRFHPPFPLRTVPLFASAAARILTDVNMRSIRRKQRRLTTMANLHAEAALQRVRNSPLVIPDGFAAIGHKFSWEYLERVNLRWSEMRSQLQLYSCLTLPDFESSLHLS